MLSKSNKANHKASKLADSLRSPVLAALAIPQRSVIHIMFQIIATGCAAVAAVASAIAAWKSYQTGENTLKFQKQFSRNQRNIVRIQAVITKLRCLKTILLNSYESTDEEFQSLEALHGEIKSELEELVDTGVLSPRKSKFFEAISFAEIVGQQGYAGSEIDQEIKRLEGRVDEIFA